MNQNEQIGKSWWPEDISAAFSAATDTLRCTRQFIGEVKATREGDDESYIDHFKNLLVSVQRGLKKIGAIQDELRNAHGEIGEPLPTVNGMGGGFSHGLIVDIGCGALNAYSVRSDEGYGHTFYVTPGTMPVEEVRRMRERFQSLQAPSFSLLALAGREAEQAARIRKRFHRIEAPCFSLVSSASREAEYAARMRERVNHAAPPTAHSVHEERDARSQAKQSRMKKEDADERARKIVDGAPGKTWTLTGLARKVGCSPTTMKKTRTWREVEEPTKPKAISLSGGIGATIGHDDDELLRLIEEQDKDQRSDGYSRRPTV